MLIRVDHYLPISIYLLFHNLLERERTCIHDISTFIGFFHPTQKEEMRKTARNRNPGATSCSVQAIFPGPGQPLLLGRYERKT